MNLKENIDLKLAWCKDSAAKYACLNWHYSKSLPAPPRMNIGVWEEGNFKGAIIFSRGASCNIGKPFKLDQTEICELTRVALKEHKIEVTKMISIAIKILKKKCPKLKLIVSYADSNEGHLGKIYQAGNWIYTGQTPNTYLYFDEQGKKYHSRQVSEKGFNKQFGEIRRVPKPSELKKVKQMGKFKYLFPLNYTIKKEILRLKKQNPNALVV